MEERRDELLMIWSPVSDILSGDALIEVETKENVPVEKKKKWTICKICQKIL